MPKKNEKTIPVTISPDANEDLQKLIDRTGLLQSELLRSTITAALRTLAERDSLTLPIKFSVNGKHSKKK